MYWKPRRTLQGQRAFFKGGPKTLRHGSRCLISHWGRSQRAGPSTTKVTPNAAIIGEATSPNMPYFLGVLYTVPAVCERPHGARTGLEKSHLTLISTIFQTRTIWPYPDRTQNFADWCQRPANDGEHL